MTNLLYLLSINISLKILRVNSKSQSTDITSSFNYVKNRFCLFIYICDFIPIQSTAPSGRYMREGGGGWLKLC